MTNWLLPAEYHQKRLITTRTVIQSWRSKWQNVYVCGENEGGKYFLQILWVNTIVSSLYTHTRKVLSLFLLWYTLFVQNNHKISVITISADKCSYFVYTGKLRRALSGYASFTFLIPLWLLPGNKAKPYFILSSSGVLATLQAIYILVSIFFFFKREIALRSYVEWVPIFLLEKRQSRQWFSLKMSLLMCTHL